MGKLYHPIRNQLVHRWRMFWLKRSGTRGFGRMAAWIASRHTAPYHQRSYLANLLPQGFVAPSACLSHPDLRFGKHVYLGDRVSVYATHNGGSVEIQNRVHLYGDSFIETGMGGRILIDEGTHIQPGCHIHAYLSEVRIGKQVEIAPGCGFYCYDHGMNPGLPIMEQSLHSKGGIAVGDGAWIGHGVTVLHGVTIGRGAVIGAGSVVVHDVPDNAIAAGVPARIVRYRAAANESPQANPATSTKSSRRQQLAPTTEFTDLQHKKPISTI
ncbi:MAG: acyltransferase [Verrucomicrobiota bacterium]